MTFDSLDDSSKPFVGECIYQNDKKKNPVLLQRLSMTYRLSVWKQECKPTKNG